MHISWLFIPGVVQVELKRNIRKNINTNTHDREEIQKTSKNLSFLYL